MLIDAARFPLVWMRMNAPSNNPDAAPFSDFEALLARKETFVLFNDEGLDSAEHEHSPEEMKQTSLWMKRHKSELRAFVTAMICIEPSAAKRLAARAFAVVYEKFWGYPILMVANEDEAFACAQELLSAQKAGAPTH